MVQSNSELKELIIQEIDHMPKDFLAEVLHFVGYLKSRLVDDRLGTAIASESVLQKDWLTPEEDLAWQDL